MLREHGLLVTTPRRAIIRALLQQDQPVDAVVLQQIAREHHASTSLGTVYRFLREMHALNLLQARMPAHGRTGWQLQAAFGTPAVVASEAGPVWLQPCPTSMRELEKIGLAERRSPSAPPIPHAKQPDSPSTIHEMLQELAFHLGYQLS